MHSFEVDTANQLWEVLSRQFFDPSRVVSQHSDRGLTRELLHVGFALRDPAQRWISIRRPPLNVAFALAEVLWILGGRRDAAFLNVWNSQLPGFVGGEPTHHGAYGYRLRTHFGFDQLERACEALSNNPNSRQVVLQLWDARIDMPNEGGRAMSGDIPCNVVSILKVRNRRLEWMQVMRSNDLVRGLPYNIVQFTFLQEVMAGWLGIEVGGYNQFADSLHVYEKDAMYIEQSGCAEQVRVAPSYGLPWRMSHDVLGEVMRRVEALIEDEVQEREITAIHEGLPSAYANIVVVLAAERLRRQGAQDEALAIAEQCTDFVLREMWLRWYESRPSTVQKRLVTALR